MGYTEVSDVRRALPGLLSDIDYIGVVESGSHITTNVYGIGCPTMLKNGIEIVVNTDYTFVRPDTITLGTNANGEEYHCMMDVGAEDLTISTMIEQADQMINSKFYGSHIAPSTEIKKTWSTYMSCGLYIGAYCAGSEEDTAKADFFLDLAHKGMDDYITYTLRESPTIPRRRKTKCIKV